MKLIVCRECFDTLALSQTLRVCACGKSGGRYLKDGVKAKIAGPATAFGVNSNDIGMWILRTAKGQYPPPYEGSVEAWCMPKRPKNIEYVKDVEALAG